MKNKNKMTLSGIGPRLFLSTLPFAVLSMLINIKNPSFLAMPYLNCILAKTVGFLWLAIGIVFMLVSGRIFFKGFKSGKLITHGTYSLCRNPLYASFIMFFLPSLVLIFYSGLILAADIALYVNFKILIKEEEITLRQTFGDEYDSYAKKVNQILPIPKFWK